MEKYSTEYIHFIKTFIANKCYMNYCNMMLKKSNEEGSDYKENILKYRYEPDVWKEILNTIHIPMKYLIQLYKNIDYEIPQHSIQVYEYKTFQEYVDTYVTLEKAGSYNYQQFIKSMKDPEFKNKVVEKYETSLYENKIKNYIIYVINLYITAKTNAHQIFTDREQLEMDIAVDIMPYLEYISKRDLHTNKHDIKTGCIEVDTIDYINNLLFTM
uniref:Uncharacterized protein n=1 Tax=viral metagenome TaxID=1070528 RepID=A0A6C0LS71_9ZZZZ